MGLAKGLLKACAEQACEYRLTVLGGTAVYAEGVKKVKSYSPTEVVLSFRRCALAFFGQELTIEKLCEGDAVVKGRVDRIERVCL